MRYRFICSAGHTVELDREDGMTGYVVPCTVCWSPMKGVKVDTAKVPSVKPEATGGTNEPA